MPSKGFKSVTISDDVYDYAMNLFIDPNTDKIRMKWTKLGITSFGGFLRSSESYNYEFLQRL